MRRNGILVGGNWVIDLVKVIDVYPDEEKLVNIFTQSSGNGGSAYNVIKDLAKLQANFPLSGVGLVGNDEWGERILCECRNMGINTRQILKTDQAHTSYTDVMSVKCSGKRTFFHQRGANALLDIDHFDFSASNDKIFHLGYLLLLDQLDIIEEDGCSRASKLLKKACDHGLITSIDIVSERSERFKYIVPSSLPYTDYLFVNEFEAGMISGIETITNDKEVLISGCYDAAFKILDMGVRSWVVLHFPDGVIAVSRTGEKLFQPSINLPAHHVIGSLGAGDAFAAGVLLGVHENWDMAKSLKLGVCAAAACLFEATSSDGLLPIQECMQLSKIYGFRNSGIKV